MTLEEAVVQVLGAAELPLKASDVAKQAKQLLGKQATPKATSATLDALVGQGHLACFAGGTAAKPQFYYTQQSLERATAAVLKPFIQGAKKAPDAAKLKAKLPASLHVHFEPALALLVGAGDAFVGKGGKRPVHAQAPRPSSLLGAAQRKAAQKMLDAVNTVRLSALTLEDFIVWIDAAKPTATPAVEAAQAVPAAPAAPASPSPVAVPTPAPVLTETLLREWYALDRLSSSTVMIPIPQTFARYADWALTQGAQGDVMVLRNFMEGLYNNGLILLEPCERPQDLPAHERAMLVPMSLGPPGWSWCWSV